MKAVRKNEGRILLPLNKFNHSLKRIREIIDLGKDKTYDLVHIIGVDPAGEDYLPLEELAAYGMGEIDKCYICDVSVLMESLKGYLESDIVLIGYQLRQIVLTATLAKLIKNGLYDEVIYYSIFSDYRLNETPASMILEDPRCCCLINELKDNSSLALVKKRLCYSRSLSIKDGKPQYGYTMKEKDIRRICREIKRSNIFKMLKMEECDF